MFANHKRNLRFPQNFPAGIEPSEFECASVELFMHDDLISHLLLHANAGIAMDVERIPENEMKKWIGIMLAVTLSPISNIEEDWGEEDDGLIPAHSISIKSGLSKGRFKFIRYHFATGAVEGGAKTFDAFQPIQTFSMT